MKKKIKLAIIILFGIGSITGGIIGYRIYNEPHADLSVKEAAYHLKVTDLINEFSNKENESHSKYSDKIISLDINTDYTLHDVDSLSKSIIISNGTKFDVKLTLSVSEANKLRKEHSKIKAEYTGFMPYDSYFETPGEVILSRAIIIN